MKASESGALSRDRPGHPLPRRVERRRRSPSRRLIAIRSGGTAKVVHRPVPVSPPTPPRSAIRARRRHRPTTGECPIHPMRCHEGCGRAFVRPAARRPFSRTPERRATVEDGVDPGLAGPILEAPAPPSGPLSWAASSVGRPWTVASEAAAPARGAGSRSRPTSWAEGRSGSVSRRRAGGSARREAVRSRFKPRGGRCDLDGGGRADSRSAAFARRRGRAGGMSLGPPVIASGRGGPADHLDARRGVPESPTSGGLPAKARGRDRAARGGTRACVGRRAEAVLRKARTASMEKEDRRRLDVCRRRARAAPRQASRESSGV
jgi:hypothetical protein